MKDLDKWTTVLKAPFPVALFIQENDVLNLVALSEEAYGILGCPLDRFDLVSGTKWFDYIHPDDVSSLIGFVPKLEELGRLSFAVRAKKPSKRAYEWVSGYFKKDTFHTDEKRYLMFFYTSDDIDFLDHQSWAFHNSSSQRLIIQDVIDTVNVPIFWKDQHRKYLGANKAFLDYFGFIDEMEIIGKTNESLGIGKGEDAGSDVEKEVLSGETVQNKTSITAQGQERVILLSERRISKGDKTIGLIGSFIDITDEVARTNELVHLAHRDELTDTHNRRSFFRWLKERQKEYIAGGDDFAVIMMDLDDFKTINDNYGHEAGDRALVTFSQRVKNNKTRDEHLFRLGGDEFIMILEHADKKKAEECRSKYRELFEKPMDIDGVELSVGVSMGIALYSDSLDIDLLMRQADQSMYEDKKNRKVCR